MISVASGVILYRRDRDDGAVRLLLLRNRRSGAWGFPKGRRDPDDEHEVGTALREVREETGFRELDLHPEFRVQISYQVNRRDGGSYHKRVTYFLARAPDAEPQISGEHDALAWACAADAEQRLGFAQLRDLARTAFDALGAD